jgi:septal ring factor EnvC (AmiA/AmiB activator)
MLVCGYLNFVFVFIIEFNCASFGVPDKKHVSANEAIQKQQQALQETQAQSAKTLKDSQSDIKSLSQRQADLEHLLKASSQPQGTQVSTTQIAAVELDLKKLSDAVSQLNVRRVLCLIRLDLVDDFIHLHFRFKIFVRN